MIYFIIYCISIFKINRSGVVLIIVVSQGIETLQSVLSVLKFKLHVTNCFCWQSTTAESNQNFIKNEQLVLQSHQLRYIYSTNRLPLRPMIGHEVV